MSIDTMKHLSAYDLEASPMTQADVPRLHELSVSVSWPHRAEDWAMLLNHGHGIVARDEIGRVVGSAMWFALTPAHAHVGMVITSPRLQSHGTGYWLMQHVFDQVGDASLVLNATRAATRLYISLGFTPVAPVYQHNGIVTRLPDGPDYARSATPADHAALHALDRNAIGADRRMLINDLLASATATVVENNDGTVRGFALCRRFGRGHVVGPLVAENENDAIALVRPHIEAHQGRFLRLDTREDDGVLRRFLVQSGLAHYDTVTRMRWGALPVEGGPARTMGLVSQALS
ncbi:GNAT family N-acetyltransferase [Salinisphaera hydrothermalis]|uniref:GNAT family N-acetyltransferase n=1 Tax=Salinisphaera hydrothermalis TaxID=563188 RepID=UPI00333F7F37